MREAAQVTIIKRKARELSEEMTGRYSPGLINEFVQFSLGVASLGRLSSAFTHEEVPEFADDMRKSAYLAAQNFDPAKVEETASLILSDEELCLRIVEANEELKARGGA